MRVADWFRDPLDVFMKRVAAAGSPGELEALRADAAGRFIYHPRRAELDALLEKMRPIVERRAREGPQR